MTTVLLIDDHPPLRKGIAAIVDETAGFKVAGEAGSIDEGLRALRELQPDIAIVDMTLPDGNGIELIQRGTESYPAITYIVLSMHARHRLMERALASGAKAYILKESSIEHLGDALREVEAGGTFVDPKLRLPTGNQADLSDDPWESLGGVELTDREREVFRMLALGQNSKQIGVILGISYKTVDNHRSRLMEKLRVTSIAEIVRLAIRTGVIDP